MKKNNIIQSIILMTHIVLFFFFIISSAIASSPIAKHEAHWQKTEYIEQSFYEIALKNEYNLTKTRIRKWNQPLAVYIKHEVGDKKLHLQLIKMHLMHLSQITGLPITYVNKKSTANVNVFFTRSAQVNSLINKEIDSKAVKLLKNSVCLANIKTNQSSEIIKATVIIPVDRARMHGKLVSCIVEELSQILGLPNDSKTIYPTIFSDRNIYKLLTGLDYIFLKLLYLPEIKTGMTQRDIEPLIKKRLHQWKRNGILVNAQKNVIKGELYHLMGYR